MDYFYLKIGICNKNLKDFDISFFYKLFKIICNFNLLVFGWDDFLLLIDYFRVVDLIRIK